MTVKLRFGKQFVVPEREIFSPKKEILLNCFILRIQVSIIST
jgi:hypothetical protein